jgi:hypothetical protein
VTASHLEAVSWTEISLDLGEAVNIQVRHLSLLAVLPCSVTQQRTLARDCKMASPGDSSWTESRSATQSTRSARTRSTRMEARRKSEGLSANMSSRNTLISPG